MSRDRFPLRGRDRDGERRGRPDRERSERDRSERDRSERDRPDRDRVDRERRDRDRGERPSRPVIRAERPESLDRIEQRARFEPQAPDWGRPQYAVGQRVAWNFVYKLANSEATHGTITRVGETCDIRWDDGLETLFLPPVVLREVRDGEDGDATGVPTDIGPFGGAGEEAGQPEKSTTEAGSGEPPADQGQR